MDRRPPEGRLTARRVLASALLLPCALLGALAFAGEPPAPSPLAGADAKARVAAAQALEKTDVAALAHALTAIGAAKTKDPTDREFLCEYALGQRSRLLRMLALESLSHVDKKGAVEFFKAHADGKEQLATVVSLDALSRLGTKDDVATAVELIKSPDELVAVAAADCSARLATQKELDAIADDGLAHPSEHVTDHTAWAVLDLLKKPKAAMEFYERRKKMENRAVRVASTLALLKDNHTPPQEWRDTLTPARDLVQKVQPSIEIKTGTEEFRKNVAAGLEWLKTNMPAAEYLVRASAKRIEIPGKIKDNWVDPAEFVIQVPVERASWAPKQLAFHLFWMGTVLWQARCGEPAAGHRGWEPAMFDAYDLCVVARLYDAGPGGLPRATFMKDQIAKHPWGAE